MLDLFIPDDAVEHLWTLQTQFKPFRYMNLRDLMKTLIFLQHVGIVYSGWCSRASADTSDTVETLSLNESSNFDKNANILSTGSSP